MKQLKPQTTLKEKLLQLKERIKKPILLVLGLFPIIGLMMYSLQFPMLNLWDLFVEYLFGSFWLAIFFIALIFFIILMMGGISYYTVLIFMMYFFLAMTIGYGYPIIVVAIAIFGTWYLIIQVFRWWENR